MRETILLAPGISGDELLRTMALHGIYTLNTRVMGSAELARYALQRAGVTIREKFLTPGEARLLVGEAVKNIDYFRNSSLCDLESIAAALNTARSLIAEGDEDAQLAAALSRGLFPEKNSALLQAYRNYLALCAEKQVIDRVTLLRRAAATGLLAGVRFRVLDSAELSPLEKELLRTLSGGSVETVSMQALYGAETGAPVHIARYLSCYGAANEAEMILESAYRGGRLDACTVAVTDPVSYSALFWDLAIEHSIPVTFGCGVPILNAAPAKLLDLYHHWTTDAFFSGEALNAILNSPLFDREAFLEKAPALPETMKGKKSIFRDILLPLRLTNDAAQNREILNTFEASLEHEPEGEEGRAATREDKLAGLPLLRYYGEMLALSPDVFIDRFARIRRTGSSPAELLCTKLDLAAKREIITRLREVFAAGGELTEELYREILGAMVCRGSAEAGALHLTGIGQAEAAMRERLYIAGLAASMFPGAPREDYLLLDADLKLFGEAGEARTSYARVDSKKARLMRLLHLASDLGAEVYLSYPGMNISELKKNNASSALFDIYREEHGGEVTTKQLDEAVEKSGYFAPRISDAAAVGQAYAEGKRLTHEARSVDPHTAELTEELLNRSYSPSAIDQWKGCPYRFFLARVLHIQEPEEEKNFQFWNPAECGTAAHAVMQCSANMHLDKENFLRISGEYFDRFAAQHRPVTESSVPREREEFLDMMEKAYDMDPQRPVVLAEEKLVCLHEASGVSVDGYPDRVEVLPGGDCVVVDFKTGRTLRHLDNDPVSCMQALLYAWLLEKQGTKVDYVEYRYLRLQRVVRCEYDDAAREAITECLTGFRQGLESGEFLPTAVEDNCKYCGFKEICPGRQNTADGEGD